MISTSDTVDVASRGRRLMLLVALTLPAGAVLIVLAYHHAAGLAEPDNLQFSMYWVGFLGAMLPLAALASSKYIDAVTRTAALVGIGLFGMVPRLQRFGPAGSDEFIHLRQSMEAYFNGDVGHTLLLLPISKEFFGLHQTASAFARLTAIPLWYSGVTVVVLAHILSILAIYQLVRSADVPAPGAAFGAVVYTLNPSWLFFDAAFSYESLALPLMLWCLAATVSAGRGTTKPAFRATVAAVLCVAVLPMIHHLTTIMLCLILAMLITARLVYWFPRAITDTLATHRERTWPLVVVASSLALSIQFWWNHLYDWLLAYLSPAWTEGLAQFSKILHGAAGHSSGKRSLFGNAPNPIYEIVSGYLFPFLVLAVYLWSFTILWRNRRRVGSALWAFAALGAMFFASMPMVLTAGGAEGAHRSWGFSFIGIAVLAGMAWSRGPLTPRPDTTQRRRVLTLFSRIALAERWRSAAAASRQPRVRAGIACLMFVPMAVGSATLGVNLSARFPGTANVGDDGRSVSREGAVVARWMAAHAPVDTPVMADRYTSLQIGSVGRMSALRPSATFPIWNLYMNADPIQPEVLKMLSDAKIRYFVVDSRMATIRPRMGYWFTRNEPGVGGKDPFPQSALDRFNCLPWLRAVFAAGPLTVYEVDRDMLRRTEAGSCEEPPV